MMDAQTQYEAALMGGFAKFRKEQRRVIEEMAKDYARLLAVARAAKMAHLHLLASICECGEPLKETDAFDVLDAALSAVEDLLVDKE
jgi:hypothetical protein